MTVYTRTCILVLSNNDHDDVHRNLYYCLFLYRYAFTVISNVMVFGIAWLLFYLNSSAGGDTDMLSPVDQPKFRVSYKFTLQPLQTPVV